MIVLHSVYRSFQRVRRVSLMWKKTSTAAGQSRLSLALVSPHVQPDSVQLAYVPLGFLFGLGFDTATEIGLLGLSRRSLQGTLALVGAGLPGALRRGHVAD